MFQTPVSAARVARSFLLLLAAIGLQPVPTWEAAEPASPSQARPAVVFTAGPAVPLPVPGAEQETGNGDDGAEPNPTHTRDGKPRDRGAASACTASFCPWRAPDALARAGRHSSPSTAPPASPV